tara:strand:- start:910 stop:1656 length:747 start_codon:yes stop_codon:yes gene_type:complete
MTREYQYNFSDNFPELYENEGRKLKALKTIKILQDYKGSLESCKLLDIGSSTGIMTYEYSKYFKSTLGIDIDQAAVNFSLKNFKSDSLDFICTPIEKLHIDDNYFDIITCSHIYEHVPDANQLMAEIYRLLKPGGVCYFAAGNRFKIIEGHYKLPFLSFFPKPIANLYLFLTNKGTKYYENHLSVRNLKKLVNKFEIIDYTLETIKNPAKYFATDLIKENSFKQKVYIFISNYFYFSIPTYLWLLKKN